MLVERDESLVHEVTGDAGGLLPSCWLAGGVSHGDETSGSGSECGYRNEEYGHQTDD